MRVQTKMVALGMERRYRDGRNCKVKACKISLGQNNRGISGETGVSICINKNMLVLLISTI